MESVDLLIHAAYDLALTRRPDIWRVNVEGTRRLLTAARDAGVGRIIVLSSMSAFEGTRQLYGQAKLDIEQITASFGGLAIRPGLVYGDHPGGTAGALLRVTRLPLVPLVAPEARQYPLHEDDLMEAVAALATAATLPPSPVGIAHSTPVRFRDLLEALAAQEDRRCRFVRVPWQLLYGALRTAELLPVKLPFRADSLLGLVRSAPFVPGLDELAKLDVHPRPLSVGVGQRR